MAGAALFSRRRFAAATALAIVAAAGFLLFRDKDIHATDAQVAAAIDPSLKFERIKVPDSENAFLAFRAVGATIDHKEASRFGSLLYRSPKFNWHDLSPSRLMAIKKFVYDNERKMSKLLAASRLRVGVAPVTNAYGTEEEHQQLRSALSYPIARTLLACNEDGTDACASALVDFVRIADSYSRLFGYVHNAQSPRARRDLYQLVDWLLTNQLLDVPGARKVLAAIPPAPKDDQRFAYAFKATFHDIELPLVRKRRAFEAHVAKYPDLFKPRPPLVGTWDELENVQMLSAIVAARVASTSRPRTNAPSAELARVGSWADAVPRFYSGSDSLFGQRVERAMFRRSARGVPNAAGRIAIRHLANPESLFYSQSAPTSWELARTQLALFIYESEHGRLPSKLGDLVPSHIQREEPYDYFSGEPLKYDPATRMVWSVGDNCRDDRGLSRRPGEDDIAATAHRPRAKP